MSEQRQQLGTLIAVLFFLISIGFSGCAEIFDIVPCKPNSYGNEVHLYEVSIDSPQESNLIAYLGYDATSVESMFPGKSGNDYYVIWRHNRINHISFHTSPITITTHSVPNGGNLLLSPDGNRFLHTISGSSASLGISDTTGQLIKAFTISASTTSRSYTQWVNDQHVAFFAKDSVKGDGVYVVDIESGSIEKIYSNSDSGGFDITPDMTTLYISVIRQDEVGNNFLFIVKVDLATGDTSDVIRGRSPIIVANGQKLIYRNGSWLSITDFTGNHNDLFINTDPTTVSSDGNSLITISSENDIRYVHWVNILDGSHKKLATVTDFKAFREPHWDHESSRLLPPFLSADGKKAYVYVHRSYISDGCPN